MDNESGQRASRCSVCGAAAPPTDTNYTLISARHGWRLTLEPQPDGKRRPIWRCPSCWNAHRAGQAPSAKPPAGKRG